MRRTILLADDSSTIQRLVKQTFADSKFDVISESNGDAAIRKFEETRPHVVLADIYMPGKNGYEVCAYIKAHATLFETPVILLVGAFDAFDEATAKEAGAVASITKPFEPGALVELVTSVLSPVEGEPDAEPTPEPEPAPAPARVAMTETRPGPVQTAPIASVEEPSADDLLGLEVLFKEEPPAPPPQGAAALTEADIEHIVDRVIQKLSSQVIEGIAWEVVPDIADKVLREELKRNS